MTKQICGLMVFGLFGLVSCGGDGDDKGSTGSEVTLEEFTSGACQREEGGEADDCDYSEYTECYQTQCQSEYEMCLGAGYKQGNFSGGVCETYMECVMESADVCENDCEIDAECTNCFLSFGTCGSSCTLPECAGGGTTPTGTLPQTSGGCDELEDCCGDLPEDQTQNCELVLQAGQDSLCGLSLQTYQAGGYCQ
jgi:hypothetical protein